MTSRKFMTLALATVLAWNCSGLRAAEHQSAENPDATLNHLAAELARAEQQAPAAPAHVDAVAPVPQEPAAHAAPAAEANHGSDVSAAAPSAPVTSDATGTTN